MPILYDDGLLYEIEQSRVAVLTGRLGSGKTRLAIEIASHFLARGYRLITNVRCVWADEPRLDYERVVLLVDEGGLWVRRATDAMKLAAYARKLGMVVLFSGKKLPHPDLCDLQIQLFLDFWKNFLLPFCLWRWEYYPGGSVKPYGGFLLQVLPWWYNSVYDTIDPGKPPEQIIGYAFARAQALFARYGYNLPGLEIAETTDYRDLTRAAQAIDDAAARLARAGRKF
jgi:hypothetical protein